MEKCGPFNRHRWIVSEGQGSWRPDDRRADDRNYGNQVVQRAWIVIVGKFRRCSGHMVADSSQFLSSQSTTETGQTLFENTLNWFIIGFSKTIWSGLAQMMPDRPRHFQQFHIENIACLLGYINDNLLIESEMGEKGNGELVWEVEVDGERYLESEQLGFDVERYEYQGAYDEDTTRRAQGAGCGYEQRGAGTRSVNRQGMLGR
ncbi:hypothetical protein GQ457_05G001140 [Hibiscus cannabinus]